jgi:predicted CopG family antitoxin
MRTTLRLADDVYRAIKDLAEAEDRSFGEVASDLIRYGLRRKAKVRYDRHFPVFDVAEDSPPITLETVKRALDDEP